MTRMGTCPGHLDEPPVEGQHDIASLGGPEVQRIREVHARLRAIQGFCEQSRTLHRHVRQARKGAQGRRNLLSGEAVDATQHPFALEHDRRACEDGSVVDCGTRSGRLFEMVAGEVSDDDIGNKFIFSARASRSYPLRHPLPFTTHASDRTSLTHCIDGIIPFRTKLPPHHGTHTTRPHPRRAASVARHYRTRLPESPPESPRLP